MGAEALILQCDSQGSSSGHQAWWLVLYSLNYLTFLKNSRDQENCAQYEYLSQYDK